jgi:L-cysteine:1D-myo-inositol 2-amino-2-deoxy-alpha-D-glucopyranoside ligase
MSYRYLGPRLDIHGGGGDLIYPHHESEIAQSEAFSGERPFAQFWVHTAMLRYQGEKMSKSLGNMVFVRDLCRTYSADAVRLCLLGHHYRQEFSFEQVELDQAQALADRLADARDEPAAGPAGDGESEALLARGLAALDDDLDTPGAIDALGALVERGGSAAQRAAVAELGLHLGLTFQRRP